jgi:hypothetical protein
MSSPLRSRSDRSERRDRIERRRRRIWSLCYGSFNPRRRSHPRRTTTALSLARLVFRASAGGIDRHLAVEHGGCVPDLTLLDTGADEVNPIMAALLDRGVAFTRFQNGHHRVCVMALVVLSRYRFMRLIRVEIVMYIVLVSYSELIGYELWLLQSLSTSSSCNFADGFTFHIVPPSAKLALPGSCSFFRIILMRLRFCRPPLRS